MGEPIKIELGLEPIVRLAAGLEAMSTALVAVRDGQSLILQKLREVTDKMSALDDKITELQDKVTALTVAEQAATALLTGLKSALDAAIAAAASAGASSAQLAALQELSDKIGTDTADLAAAVAANTPTP